MIWVKAGLTLVMAGLIGYMIGYVVCGRRRRVEFEDREGRLKHLGWEMNELLSHLFEVHVEHHMDGAGEPIWGCEACGGWDRGRRELTKELLVQEAEVAAGKRGSTP